MSEEESVVAVGGCNKKREANNKKTRNEHLVTQCTLSLTTKFEGGKNLTIKQIKFEQ